MTGFFVMANPNLDRTSIRLAGKRRERGTGLDRWRPLTLLQLRQHLAGDLFSVSNTLVPGML